MNILLTPWGDRAVREGWCPMCVEAVPHIGESRWQCADCGMQVCARCARRANEREKGWACHNCPDLDWHKAVRDAGRAVQLPMF